VVLVVTLTQQEPQTINTKDGWAKIPYFPQPFYGTAQLCLRVDPRERSMNDILSKPKVKEPLPAKPTEEPLPAKRGNLWLIVPIIVAILLIAVWLGRKSHQSPSSPAKNAATESSPASAAQPTSPPHDQATSRGTAQGRVLQEVSPDVSPGARKTITGHIKVSVQVSVDSSGNVSAVRLVSPGPSKYFAEHALAAARGWKFAPPQVNGQASPSEWVLHFQFGRTSTQVSPTQTKP
jgi:TonB family protein